MKNEILQKAKKYFPAIYAIVASYLISFGWNWYHAKRDPIWKFALIVIGVWAAVYILYRIGKFLYKTLIKRLGYNDFWHNEFYDFLDRLFFVASLLFAIFFEIGFIKHRVFDYHFTCFVFYSGQAACQAPEFWRPFKP